VKTGNRFPALRLVRAGNCVVAGATSLAGSWASTATLARDKPWLLAIAAMLIAAFGNAYNDICDLPADRVNRPDRVLVRGDMDMTLAMRLAGWCLTLGLMLAAFAFVNALILAVTVATVLFLYDRNLKFQPLIGNAAIATICGATVAFGAMAGGRWNRQVLILIVCAFSLTLIRELYKDIQDVEGDRAMGARTFPILFGERTSARLALLPLAFTVYFVLYRIFSSTPDWTGAYVAGIVLTSGLVWTAVRSLSTTGPTQWGNRSREVKVWIMLGVVWVLLWRISL
jgi:geranylgeranylglycerol-phosphate geranylgeranyltransferase